VRRRARGANSSSPMWEEEKEEPMNQIWLRPWEPDSSFHVKTHRVLSFLEWITQWEPPQHWSLHQVKPLVEGITKIGPALNYYCLVHFSFGNALDLGLHHTLKWCIPKAQSLKLGVIFVQNLRGVLHHCWPVIKNGNR
jgi:hypothetical protein